MKSNREAKQAAEANKVFFARREIAAIRKAARRADPNSGFRLSAKSVELANKIRSAAEIMDAEKQRVANLRITERDRRLAEREAGATKRAGKVYGYNK